jgi:hypothetical protein
LRLMGNRRRQLVPVVEGANVRARERRGDQVKPMVEKGS